MEEYRAKSAAPPGREVNGPAMDLFPYVETLKVGAAWAALLFVWPGVVFRGLLRGRGLTFRFLFCAIVQPLLISTVVLSLGLLHILNVWLVRLLFWGAPAASLLLLFWKRRRIPAPQAAPAALPARWKEKWFGYRKHLIEYGVLAVILLFAAAFFLNGAFHDYSFGFYDLYTHYGWTSALVNGKIFSAGVYPEGMHCFLYALNVLFGVSLHSCMVFLGGLHNALMFLVAAYCLFKELFRSRHAALFVLAAWAVFDGIGPAALSAVARMSWTLPEEFALHLVFLCPLVLLRYLRDRDTSAKWYRDWNLLFLAAGVALALSTHPYVLAMAFFPCCAVILAHFMELRPFRRLLPPVCAALCGLVFGLLPMLAAYLMGTELQGSFWWGISVIQGESGAASEVPGPPGPVSPDPVSPGPVSSGRSGLLETLRNMAKSFYEDGWSFLFGDTVAVLLILASLLVLALAVVGICVRLRRKPQEAVLPAGMAEGYLIPAASLAAFVLLYALPYMGLPELVKNVRTLCVTQMLAFAVAGILADLLIALAQRALGRKLPDVLMALGCLLLYIIAYRVDFHQTAYWWLYRYNAAVTVTDRIMDEYPKGTYKIISLWDEACQADAEDYEELLAFVKGVEEGGYSVPAEYVFLYVEKHPIGWGQLHFTTAPGWLARDNYETNWPSWNPSRCPEFWYGEVSRELALREIYYDSVPKDYFSDMTGRMILSSKAYAWYEEFSAAHPQDIQVYYEDGDFACYLIRQDPAAPLDLSAGAAG